MSLDKLTVATRLALAFGVTTFLGVLIAVIGTTQLSKLSSGLDEVANDRMVKVQKFTVLMNNMNDVGRFTRNIIINPASDSVDEELKKIAGARAANSQLLSDLDKTVNLPRGRELIALIKDKRGPYYQALDKVIALAQAGQPKEAGELLLGEVRSQQNILFKAVEESNQLQMERARAIAKEGSDTASRSQVLMLSLAVVMAALGSLTAWVVIRSLGRALGAEPAQVSDTVQRVALGELNNPIQLRHGDQHSTMAAVKGMQESLASTVSGVRMNAESVATASAEIAQGNHDLSARTEQQASALEQTAASMEELSSTVKQNAENAAQANQLAKSASSVAVRGGEVVAQVVETMKGINESSRKIADIISVIDGIAFQTNILALNAAVEAARAGEQGRGFAVVASEVRSLAGRSAEAAKEIKSLISASVERVEHGSALVDQAGATMTEVVTAIKRATDIMGEISSASNEQAQGVAQVGEAVAQMDQFTQQNAALVEQMAAAASSLQKQAQDLVGTVAGFKLGGAAHSPKAPRPPAATLTPVPVRSTAARTPAAPKPTARAPKALTAAKVAPSGEDDWSSF